MKRMIQGLTLPMAEHQRENMEGDIRIFRFAVLAIFDYFFGFCAKRLWFFAFGVRCGLRIFRFLASGFRFS